MLGTGGSECGHGDRSEVTSLGRAWGLVDGQGRCATVVPEQQPSAAHALFTCASAGRTLAAQFPCPWEVKPPVSPPLVPGRGEQC